MKKDTLTKKTFLKMWGMLTLETQDDILTTIIDNKKCARCPRQPAISEDTQSCHICQETQFTGCRFCYKWQYTEKCDDCQKYICGEHSVWKFCVRCFKIKGRGLCNHDNSWLFCESCKKNICRECGIYCQYCQVIYCIDDCGKCFKCGIKTCKDCKSFHDVNDCIKKI